MHQKPHLPTKVCPVCERPFTWRAKWKNSWDSVLYCSKRCSAARKAARNTQPPR
ncbi:MAG: DUF2256 domain-containing protein [Proteobacteria bacterium]|nr:DUF2256 domain-containing protein [Pseudomonadota bacterium]MDA0953558.1 DUF2256 domain-containing protein [Pseudomonadota bacterium]